MARQAIWSSGSNQDTALAPWLAEYWSGLDLSSRVAFYFELRAHAQKAGLEDVNGAHRQRLDITGPRCGTKDDSMTAIMRFLNDSPFLKPIRQNAKADE